MTYNSCLLGVPIFQGLSEADLCAISDLIVPLYRTKNESLFQVGDELNHLYIVHQGSLKVYGLAENGKTSVLRLLSEGDFIGEHALLQAAPSEVGVDALESSHICMIQGAAFSQLLERSPKLSMHIIQALLNRLQAAEEQSLAKTTLSAKERLMSALMERKNDNDRVVLDVSKRELASSLGMAQETLSRLLGAMAAEGIIKLEGQRVIQFL